MPKKRNAAANRLDDARARMYHDLIFEAAEFVFGAKGFEGAAMQDIAAEAGVSLKTVYASYPGKRDLYMEIMRVRGRALMDCVDAAAKEVERPTEKLEACIRALVHFLFEHADWLRIHLRSRLSWAVRPEDEATADLWQAGQEAYRAILQTGAEEGEFRADDPMEMSLVLQAMMKIQVAHAVDAGEDDPDAVADRVMEWCGRLVRVGGPAHEEKR